MANVKKPAINSRSAIPTGGITATNASCVSKSKHENARIVSKQQQKALNNFLNGRQFPLVW